MNNLKKIKLGYIMFLFLMFWNQIVIAQANNFPYKLNKKDVILLPAGVGLYFGSGYISDNTNSDLTLDEISRLNKTDVNFFDRPATENWSKSANTLSDVLEKPMRFLPLTLIIPQAFNKEWGNSLTIATMYLELFMITKGITYLTKSITGRIRPYLYNTSMTVEERYGLQMDEAPSARTSFYSGHTVAVFASAVFLSKVYTDTYGKSAWSKTIWGVSLSAAAVTGYCRYASGEHYPTDVIVGALVGSALGYIVPELHKKTDNKIDLSASSYSFSLVYNF